MADSAQDRRLPATAKKLGKARSQGQVARSRDLGHLAAFGAGGALLLAFGPWLIAWMSSVLVDGLRFDAVMLADPRTMGEQFDRLLWKLLVVVVPLGLVMSAVAVVSSIASGGWNFTLKPLVPSFGKLDPIAGLGRMVSKSQLTTLLKASGLALVLGTVGAMYLQQHLADFAQLSTQPLPAALRGAGDIVFSGLVALVLVLVVFAVVDVPLQRFLMAEELKMSFEEVKQEGKDAEGNPEAKGKIKQRMRSLARSRMLSAVPAADIVVMNPTHYAVALKYDEASGAAPRVVAKGADLLALKIRDIATASKVPVLQAPPLARALYAHCELDQEIPAALFGTVAQVLAWVYQLRAAMGGQGVMPAALPSLAVPAELDPMNKLPRTRSDT